MNEFAFILYFSFFLFPLIVIFFFRINSEESFKHKNKREGQKIIEINYTIRVNEIFSFFKYWLDEFSLEDAPCRR